MKLFFLYLMATAYIAAGINHFINPNFYIKMIRDFLPFAPALVFISGIAEMMCGVGLFIPAMRVFAAWSTISLLVAIFPANIYMAMHAEKWHLPLWGLLLRLPVQFVLIWWAYIYTRP
jgi:uncharacterized membrane protein